MSTRHIVLSHPVRTAIGAYNGTLKGVPATEQCQCCGIWPSLIDDPGTSPRSTAAGTSATIDAAPARQSRHHHRSPELHRRLESPTNNFH